MKIPLNGSHIDLDEIAMVGPLMRGPRGSWVFGVQWKRTGTTSNVEAFTEADEAQVFSITDPDKDRPAAVASYKAFLEAWYGSDLGDKVIPISEFVPTPNPGPVVRP